MKMFEEAKAIVESKTGEDLLRAILHLPTDDELRQASRCWAIEVVHLWDAPPIVVEWLETGREDIRAAAWDAAWDAAPCAARDAAAYSAAPYAAPQSEWDTTQGTYDAAWYTARAAACAAEGHESECGGDVLDHQIAYLLRIINEKKES